MADEAPVVVATNAFGMGVDKADVRTVCHETVPELARGLLPGGRPRRPRRQAGALPAVRRRPRQGPARPLHRALGGRPRTLLKGVARRIVARRASADGEPPRYDLGVGELSLRARRRGGGARDRRPPRPRGRDPAGAVGAGPLTGRSSAPGTRGARRLPDRRAGGHPRALAPVPRGVGLGRGRGLPPRRASCATSATARRPRPSAPAATSAIPGSRSSRRACRPRRCAPAARRWPPATAALDAAILDIVAARRARRSGARARSRSSAAAARRRSLKHSYDGLPQLRRLSRPARATAMLAASTRWSPPARCADRRAVPETRAGHAGGGMTNDPHRLRVGVLASGAGHEPAGDPRQRPRARGRRRGRRLRQARRARRSSARGRRGRDGRLPRAEYADREARDVAMATWLVDEGVELVVLAGYMQLLTRHVPRRLPAARRQRPPGAAAGVPGRARGRAGARVRGQGLRRHRPLRGRGDRLRADHPPAGGRAPRGDRPGRGARGAAADRARTVDRSGAADRQRNRPPRTHLTRGAF